MLVSALAAARGSATATAESPAVPEDEESFRGEVTGIPEGPCERVLFDLPLNCALRDATLLDFFFGIVRCPHCYPDSRLP